ncbi:MAG: S8 family serine peptidase [Ruminococcaceae bacterium]|nr:S8 family serine peptidase [Oscillospiraceae bacterium]
MKNKQVLRRLISGILAAAVATTSVVVPTAANDRFDLSEISSNGISLVSPSRDKLVEEDLGYADEDEVRVSIVLEDASTISAGFDIETIATDSKAVAYRDSLKVNQQTMTEKIEKATKEDLDVVHNLTLAANIISANVKFGQIKAIEKVSGVKTVVVETKYDPAKTVETDTDKPNMVTSSAQIGSGSAWAQGYTGAGSIVAVIDTGIDSDHQSFDGDALMYSLRQNAKVLGKDAKEYIASLGLLDAAKVEAVLDQLNVKIDPAKTYLSEKIPFAYNYIDNDYDITHDNDDQGGHGSHVEGIAAANKYINDGYGDFTTALSTTYVQGVAPDAQILTMKVFGKGGGAFDSDYMLAIEDAIVLGADSINLSLGSANGGTSKNSNAEYQKIFDDLTNSGAVVSISSGNAGHWADSAYTGGYLYADDVNTQTDGTPGSFTNAFTVASVENIGTVSPYFILDSIGLPVVYRDSNVNSYGEILPQDPFTALTNGEDEATYEYVLLPMGEDEEGNPTGIGTEEEWEALADVLEGKIAVCARGNLNFTAKAENAVKYGAIATIVYNNVAGEFGMDFSDYTLTEPAISVTNIYGQYMQIYGEEQEDGKYYTGTITVKKEQGVFEAADDNYMSDFSSWGVPGSLEMKPEIAAPGGNIYSVDGEWAETDKYVSMSGTSMAAPQIAGMAAVAAQYIRENGLDKKTGLSVRTLAQSLLMSTAEPMFDEYGDYYSVLQQGAGIANIGNVINADSYILMDDDANAGAKDGKVKVELGDDPAKKGVYEFSFTIHNLTNTAKSYDLSADFFIQAVGSDGGAFDAFINDETENLIMAQFTMGVPVKTVFSCGNTANVPANGELKVKVTVTLDDVTKNYINSNYANGTYIEGFVYADGAAQGGEIATNHSIPVLGFYGNWSSASMFDKGSFEQYMAGDENRAPYMAVMTGSQSLTANAFGVTYGGVDGPYPLGGNPYIEDEVYHYDRNAVNGVDGTVLSLVQFAAIRNAADSKFIVYNETTKQTLVETSLGAVTGAYYYSNAGRWVNYSNSFKPNFEFSGVNEGDKLTITFALAPEYYMDANGNVRWEDVDMTNALTTTVTIDNTKPEIVKDPVLKDNTLTVTVKDNQYIAAVLLTNKSGSRIYASVGADEDAKIGEEYTVAFDVDGINADSLYMRVCDYAGNITTVEIPEKFGEGTILPNFIAFNVDLGDNYWVGFDGLNISMSDFEKAYDDSNYAFNAATVADHIVYAIDEDGLLVTMPDADLADTTEVINIGSFFDDEIIALDMAYNEKDGYIYALVAAVDGYDIRPESYMIRFDKLYCVPELVGAVPEGLFTLACDKEGNFYSAKRTSSEIYKYTAETVENGGEAALAIDLSEKLGEEIACGYYSLQTMAWNVNNDKLYWAFTDDWMYVLFEIDLKTGEVYFSDDYGYQIVGLIIPDKSTPSVTPDWAKPCEATEIMINANTTEMYKGAGQRLTVTYMPWTAERGELVWVSSDESVLTVDRFGRVRAVGEGNATVTAYLKDNEKVSDSVSITVNTIEVILGGALQDEDGNPMMFSWNMAVNNTWEASADLNFSMVSATQNTDNGHVYIMDGSSFSVHEIDPHTGEQIAVAANNIAPMWDMAYSEMFSTEDEPMVLGIYAEYLFGPTNPLAITDDVFDMWMYLMFYTGAECFTAVTRLGYVDVIDDETEEEVPAERFLLLDNLNYLWTIDLFESADGYMSCYFNFSDKPVAGLTEEYPLIGTDDIGASMITGEDGKVYLSACDGETNNLYVIDVEFTDEYNELDGAYEGISGTAKKIGDAGDGVWPMLLTKAAELPVITVTDEETGITVTLVPTDTETTEEDVTLIVEPAEPAEGDENSVAYLIQVVDEDGNPVEFYGEAIISIPVPEDMDAQSVKVFYKNADGSYTKIEAELVPVSELTRAAEGEAEESYALVFTVDKFGTYVLSTKDLDDGKVPDTTPEDTTSSDVTTEPADTSDSTTTDANPSTGIAIAIVPAVVSAAVVMVTKRRNRK